MTPRESADLDQAEAKEREFDRAAQRAALWFLVAMAAVCAYAVLAALGALPAMPWAPLGKAHH